MKYIIDKKTLKEFLKYESERYEIKSSRYPLVTIRENKLLYRFNFLLRKLEYYTNSNKIIRKRIARLRYIRLQRKYMMFLPINVFDKGLKLIHLGPRMVNGNALVGKNFIMHVNTNIVAGGVNDLAPKVGDNCIMAINSSLIGGTILGDNTVVGAGAVVTKDFSEGNMTIAGVPAKKISDSKSVDWSKEKREKYNKH